MPNANPGAQEREANRRTLRGAMLWAAVGAALFLGIGGSLPVWDSGVSLSGHTQQLWRALYGRFLWLRFLWREGYGVPPLEPFHDDLVFGPVLLTVCGLGAGLTAYVVWRMGKDSPN